MRGWPHITSHQWVTSHCFRSTSLSLNDQYKGFSLYFLLLFYFTRVYLTGVGLCKRGGTGKNKSRIHVCIWSFCSVKNPGKRGRTGKKESRIHVCIWSLCSAKIPWQRTGPTSKFWEKSGILLAIPPDGTIEKEQEHPEQDIWGDWENIKLY